MPADAILQHYPASRFGDRHDLAVILAYTLHALHAWHVLHMHHSPPRLRGDSGDARTHARMTEGMNDHVNDRIYESMADDE